MTTLTGEPVAHPSTLSVPRAPGRLSRALIGLMMKRAIVVSNERIADRFHLVTLEGPALAGVSWTPGDKIQVAMGSAFVARTYTPMDWDVSLGRTRILGYAHGDGPGSVWVEAVDPGAQCDLFGPRTSLKLEGLGGPLVVVGDETSIGLAHALTEQDRDRPVACVFEVDDVESARSVTARLGLPGAALFERLAGDAHLEAIEVTIGLLAATDAAFVLTGRAAAIQRCRQSLKRHAVPATRIVAKAYWAPGKTGMD